MEVYSKCDDVISVQIKKIKVVVPLTTRLQSLVVRQSSLVVHDNLSQSETTTCES